MDDDAVRKAAKNEVISRTLNEGLARGEAKWPSDDPTFICECANLSCTVEMNISLEVYGRVREHPSRFVVVPGHVNPEIERKVDEGPGYEVVEKTGPGREVVERSA